MSSQAVDRVIMPVIAAPDRVGQATAVEQSRAIAEVLAAVELARRFPRSEAAALAAIKTTCQQKALAEKAFYRFPRAGGTVSGESIHLARELARCWTNIDYGIKEMSRDDDLGQSEMLAYAWDLQANTRVTNSFISPHKRDKKGGPERLVDLRDIYETNTNNGARRVRECIFAVLPPYIIEAAKKACEQSLKAGDGQPLRQRVADAINTFEADGIVLEQLERKLGRPADRWDEQDVVQLQVIWRSIRRGEVTREEEFPPARVTAAEIQAAAARPASASTGQPSTNQQGDGNDWSDVQTTRPPDYNQPVSGTDSGEEADRG